MTLINEDVAKRRFHQGLYYLFGMAAKQNEELNQEVVLGILSVMAYLAAYAYPKENLYGVKQTMIQALEPLKDRLEVIPLIDKALEIAEVFRRPWTEPGSQGEKTI